MKLKYSTPLQLLVFAGILAIFYFGFTSTRQQANEQDLLRVKEAIQKAALECYSIEGSFPESVTYLEEQYGLYLQRDVYSIRYEFVAGNIMPQTNVYVKEGK